MVMDIQLTSCHIYAVASRLAVVEIPLFLLCLLLTDSLCWCQVVCCHRLWLICFIFTLLSNAHGR